MFRRHQSTATCFCIIAVASTAAAAGSERRPQEDVSSVAGSAPAKGGEIVQVSNLQPFTHVAYIPVGADLSSIKFKGLKAVKVPTKLQSVMETRYCEERPVEPGGSMFCPRTTDESPVPAYRVSYSYRGQPMASDESGNTYFTFSVYFRPDELGPEMRRALSARSIGREASAEFFQLTTSRDPVHQIVIEQANSTFCDGKYVDGNWTHTNLTCKDNVAYKVVASASAYITMKLDSATSIVETAAAAIGPWVK